MYAKLHTASNYTVQIQWCGATVRFKSSYPEDGLPAKFTIPGDALCLHIGRKKESVSITTKRG
jgi:hypothetical protein